MQSLADLISRIVQSATSLYQLKALEPEPHLVECLTKALYDMETVNDYCGIGEAGLYDTLHYVTGLLSRIVF